MKWLILELKGRIIQMNTIVKFFLERIFIVVFGIAIIIIGIINPRYALMNLWTVFQRVQFDNKIKK